METEPDQRRDDHEEHFRARLKIARSSLERALRLLDRYQDDYAIACMDWHAIATPPASDIRLALEALSPWVDR